MQPSNNKRKATWNSTNMQPPNKRNNTRGRMEDHRSAQKLAHKIQTYASQHQFYYMAKANDSEQLAPVQPRGFVLPSGKRIVVLLDKEATYSYLPLSQGLPDNVTLVPCFHPNWEALAQSAAKDLKSHQICAVMSTIGEDTSSMIRALADISYQDLLIRDDEPENYYVWISNSTKASVTLRCLLALTQGRCCLVAPTKRQVETCCGVLTYVPSSIQHLLTFLRDRYVPFFPRECE